MKVIEAGFAATVQDLGRKGYQRLGVPLAGAMDGFALMAANHLVGNPFISAGIETAYAGLRFLVERDCLAAGSGRGFELDIDGVIYPLWKSVLAHKGQTLQLCAKERSGWGYLAFSGGIETPVLLGSRATYLPGKWPGYSSRDLIEGDQLPLGDQPSLSKLIQLSERVLPRELIPQYSNSLTIRFVPIAETGREHTDVMDSFQKQIYQIENTSRMAYRLAGDPILISGTMDILSEGVGAGVIQLLGSGQPLVLMRDAQTTGGYLKLGTVISADLDLLAQGIPLPSEVRFCSISIEQAQTLWREKIQHLSDVR